MDSLKALYLKYLQINLPRMKKEHLVKVIAPLIVKAVDFTDETQCEVVREALANDMVRNADLWGEEEKAALLGEEAPPALPVGESDEHIEAPLTMAASLEYLKVLVPSGDVTEEDLDNAHAVLEQLSSFLFDTEVPEIHQAKEALAFQWFKGKRGCMLLFTEGDVFIHSAKDRESDRMLVLDEDGLLKKEDVEAILAEVHSVKY